MILTILLALLAFYWGFCFILMFGYILSKCIKTPELLDVEGLLGCGIVLLFSGIFVPYFLGSFLGQKF